MDSVAARSAVEWGFIGAATGLLAAGGMAWLAGASGAAAALWSADTVIGLIVASLVTGAAVLHRQASVDVIAVLALVGALLVGEAFAGAVITLMLATGRLLDARAEARAQRDLRLLVERAPQRARRRVGASDAEEVPVGDVRVGDRLLVAAGEVVPVDGRLASAAVLDESALTGEPLPVSRSPGDTVRSGVVNAGDPFEVVTTVVAAESTYAGLVRLVDQARADTAPFVRTADRLAAWFVPATLLVAAAAWLTAGTADRAVAVLVVATPCPLLLAAPIALISGLSRAARNGVIVKGGGALEQLAAGRVLLFDKTGTLTAGRPRLTGITSAAPARPAAGPGEMLRLAASLEQLSPHVLASAVVSAALERGLALSLPSGVQELHGAGIEGIVDGRRVRAGRADWILAGQAPPWAESAQRRAELDSSLAIFIAIDDRPAGALLLADPLRPDAPRMVRTLRAAGIDRVVLVTGDRADVATRIGRLVGVDEVLAGCAPAEKVEAVRRESARAASIMVGDGINDAPALAAAGAGVALAARGATASSEAADVVLTVDRIDALAVVIGVSHRCKRIARQAVGVGMGLSGVAMALAFIGVLDPAGGAVAQEGIDVLAILIALRALAPGPTATARLSSEDEQTVAALHAQHESIEPLIDEITVVADALSADQPDLRAAVDLAARLESVLLAHERDDERLLVPLVSKALDSVEATAALSLSHAEIEHQVNQVVRLLATMPPSGPTEQDVADLRRRLYELHAILRLHNAQEAEGASSLGNR